MEGDNIISRLFTLKARVHRGYFESIYINFYSDLEYCLCTINFNIRSVLHDCISRPVHFFRGSYRSFVECDESCMPTLNLRHDTVLQAIVQVRWHACD